MDSVNEPGRDGGLRKALPAMALWLAAVIALLWFARATAGVLLVAFFAIVLSIVVSAPVTWLEDRGWRRLFATLLVVGIIAGLVALLFWLIVPRLTKQTVELVRNVPDYVEQLRDRASGFLDEHPKVEEKLPLDAERAADLLPRGSKLLSRLGTYSLSIFGGIALLLVFLGIILYAVLRPRPLLELYLNAFPPRHRDAATRAFSRASNMVVGWMWSNVIVGSGEAIAAWLFLTYMAVPGALVWAALAFFAELVPKIGLYVMALPPILVALATDPKTALWVTLFYLAMNEITGDFIMPRIRASTMDLHPVSVLLMMLLMAAAFGLAGALIATPITAFVKAYYEEFVLAGRLPDPSLSSRVEAMLHRQG